MTHGRPKPVPFRRRRDGRTDYKKRLSLLLSKKPRLVARFTNTQVIGQVVQFKTAGDIIVVGVNSLSLQKMGWKSSCKNIPAAYLTGFMLGKKALAKGQKEVVFDTGFKKAIHKGKVYAFLKGVLDSGLNVPHGDGEEIFPTSERLQGEHLSSKGAVELFNSVKKKIEGM
ncbi:MAG: 50S ribosomal protein L18 [archaeon]|nr:50S ribosomal protein L18 [archaeon]